MSIVRPAPEKLRLRVAALTEEMEKCRRLVQYLTEEGWKDVVEWADEGEKARMERLLRHDLALGETTALRAEVLILRALKDLPNKKRLRMAKIAEEAEHLRSRLETWHTRGYPDVEPALDAAKRISDQPQAGQS